jgi:polar amino acid transport system substrate-binding protein
MLEQGQADLMIGLQKTPEREKFLTFLTPPSSIQHFPLRFFKRANSKITINRYEDLAPLTIGVLRGAAYFDQFDHDSQLNKVEVTSRKQLVNMLLQKRIDTFIDREESIMPLLPLTSYQQKLTLAQFAYDHEVASYIAIAKKSHLLSYQQALADKLALFLKDGTIETIHSNRQDIFGTNSE